MCQTHLNRIAFADQLICAVLTNCSQKYQRNPLNHMHIMHNYITYTIY